MPSSPLQSVVTRRPTAATCWRMVRLRRLQSMEGSLPPRRVAGRDCSHPAPSERHVQVSLHAAQALRTLLAERGRATANAWLWPHLHHTRLEPRHRQPVGECTSQCRHCRHLPSLLRRLAKLSGEARPDGRLPACAWGYVARRLNPYPPHYRMAFASSILPLPHVYRLALRLAFPYGRHTGLPCSVSVTANGVGALCPPVA